ncbi:MFS transporter [Rubrobacter taiwanensis]|uniref:MFS transporter n=1 Tax=Rubrobacter taiwanensis TaxID=185139 RepID=A0A4R1BN54_9ACTN|nr:MFS transporter [Rubrobacter taiwanensis]TCJ18909.1 MFS transporter [Rubrobacter taiwanensis]
MARKAYRGTIFTRQVLLLLFTSLAAFSSFQLLLSVVPLYVRDAGGGSSDAGLATMALMLTTVVVQIQMPRILGRFGYRPALAAGLLFLGLPTFFYPAAESVPSILLVTLLRGVGFGITTVVSAALIAELIPVERRGEGIGLYGLAAALPTVFGLPFGIWLAQNTGYPAVFTLAAAAPLLGIAAALGIRAAPPSSPGEDGRFLAGLRRGALLRPFAVFTATTVSTGVVVTFLPLAAPGAAAAALLVLGLTTTFARWWAGRLGDRYGPHLLLAPGLAAAAAGMVALAQSGQAPLLIGGAVVYGLGLGALQNATLVLMMNRVKRSEYGLASTLWNVAFDAGTGAGALAFGLVIEAAGFSPAFYLTGALLLAAMALVRLDMRRAP